MINKNSSTIERIELQSSLDSLRIVEELIDRVLGDYSFPEDAYGNVLIAVTEAINNAIVHGNTNVSTKKIILEVNDNSSSITFSIKDEGVGFDFDNLPDPTAPENIEKPHGRGVFLMKSLADEVNFYDNGSKVEIVFSK